MENTVSDYIAAAPAELQPRLHALRALIVAHVPNVAEKISWEMPSYYLNGHPFVHFSVSQKHIGFHIGPDEMEEWAAKGAFEGYSLTKSTLHLPHKKELPLALLTDMLDAKYAAWQTK